MPDGNLMMSNAEQGSALLLCHQKAPSTAGGRLPEHKGETRQFLPASRRSYAKSSKREEGNRELANRKPLSTLPVQWDKSSYKLGQFSLLRFSSAMFYMTSPAKAGLWSCILVQCIARGKTEILTLWILFRAKATLKSQHLYNEFYCSSSMPIAWCKCKLWTSLVWGRNSENSCIFEFSYQPSCSLSLAVLQQSSCYTHWEYA